VPDTAQAHRGYLEISGQVAVPRTVSGADLATLHRAEYVEAIVDKEGGSMTRRWRGTPLLEVLALAQPLDTARYVRVCAGSYALPVALAAAQAALICDELDGQALTLEHGAPWRLLLPGAHQHTSVKWIDRLELTEERGSYDAGCGRTG
jgi:DMSO/TMAO reductase YedYZ molybdopterin-dependent catalytic subunit